MKPLQITPLGTSSPLRLFSIELALRELIPAPLHLMEFVPGRLAQHYALDETGMIRNIQDRYDERTILYADGSRCRVEVNGNQRFGLPTVHDWDFLLAILVLRDQGKVDDEGFLTNPSHRLVLRAAGRRNDSSDDAIQALRRGLVRWGLTIRTVLDLGYADAVKAVREGGGYPVKPGGRPAASERDRSYGVLHYDLERVLRGDTAYNIIERLRIDPVWLAQTDAGITAWIDPEKRAALPTPTDKALYQWLVIRTAHGSAGTQVLPLADLLRAIGRAPEARPAMDRTTIAACAERLVSAGILADADVKSIARGCYEVRLTPGADLDAARRLRGIGGADPAALRLIVSHLAVFGIGERKARQLMRTDPAQVLSALRRAYFERSQGRGVSGGWIAQAVSDGWSWDDPDYRVWLKQMEATAIGGRPALHVPKTRTDPEQVAKEPEVKALAPAAPPTAELGAEHSDRDAWQRAASLLLPTIGEQGYRTWLEPTWLDRVEDGTVHVRTPNPFAVEWIGRWRERLETFLSTILDQPVRLEVRAAEASSRKP